jgi:hypothetical protein
MIDETEFKKYIRDYLKEHPEEVLQYWSVYPPGGEIGNHYAIFTTITKYKSCSHYKASELISCSCTGEQGLIFDVEVEE